MNDPIADVTENAFPIGGTDRNEIPGGLVIVIPVQPIAPPIAIRTCQSSAPPRVLDLMRELCRNGRFLLKLTVVAALLAAPSRSERGGHERDGAASSAATNGCGGSRISSITGTRR